MISLDVGHFPDVDDNVVEILSLYPNTSFLSPPPPPHMHLFPGAEFRKQLRNRFSTRET